MTKKFWFCALLLSLLFFALPLAAAASEPLPVLTIDSDEDLASFQDALSGGTAIPDELNNTIRITGGELVMPVRITGGYDLTLDCSYMMIFSPLTGTAAAPVFTVDGGAGLTLINGKFAISGQSLLITGAGSRCVIAPNFEIMGNVRVENGGTLTLGGVMDGGFVDGVVPTVAVGNGGTLVMTGGRINNEPGTPHALSVEQGGTANITGGTVASLQNAGQLNVSGTASVAQVLNNIAGATATIGGGTFYDVVNVGTMTINGGALRYVTNVGTLTINGGTFTCGSLPALYNSGIAELRGGTFQSELLVANTYARILDNTAGGTLTFTYSADATSPLSVSSQATPRNSTLWNDSTLLSSPNTRVKLDGVDTRPADIPTRTSATITLAPTTVPGTPGSYQITPQAVGYYSLGANGLAISFTWTAPDDGGSPITGYKLKYGTSASLLDREATLAADATGCTIDASRFLSDTAYYYELYAVNALGTSVKTVTLSAATPTATVYPVTFAGVQVTDFIAHDILAGLSSSVKATYTPKTATSPAVLTLSPISGNAGTLNVDDAEGIAAEEPLVIETVGAVTLFQNQHQQPQPFDSVIDAHGYPLIFRGGTLTIIGIYGVTACIGVLAESVTVEGTAGLNIHDNISCCIYADSLTVKGRATLFCSNRYAIGFAQTSSIWLSGTLTVAGDATVTAEGASYGIAAASIVLSSQGSSALSAQNSRPLGSPPAAMLTATGDLPALSVTPVSANAAYRVTATVSDTVNASDAAAWDRTTPLGGVASPYLYVAAALEKAPPAPADTPTYGHIPDLNAPGFAAGGKPAPADDPNPNTGVGGRASF